ncbi:hypothetical protein [Halorussus halobius]|nr:hypothetical protein [Halorussus halobius]
MEILERVLQRPAVVNAMWVGMIIVTKAGIEVNGCHCGKTGP